MRPLRRASVAALAAALLAGCASTAGHGTTASSTVPRLARRPTALPSGFSAPGNDALRSVADLTVLPATTLDPKALRRATMPSGTALRGAVAAVINQPVPVDVRPLLVSTDGWRAGAHITVVAATRAGGQHDVLFILQGPGSRAERLVACRDGLAAGVVVLPTPLAHGTWYLAVQDLSALSPGPNGRPLGTALVGLGVVTVR